MHSASNNTRYSVIVADDHKIFRDGMAETLKQVKSVAYVRQAANGDEVMEQLQENKCHIIFMDINMPGKDGIATTREVILNYPTIKVIALTMYDDRKHLIDMINAGAIGYLLKSTDKKEIAEAIDAVMTGTRFYGKDISTLLVETTIKSVKANAEIENSDQLLPKEIEFLQLIYKELTTKEIADQLGISPRTIERQRLLLFQKTGTHNIAGLIKYAIKYGYVTEN